MVNISRTTFMNKDEISYKIIGCAMNVHNALGPGFQEVINQRCLAIEFDKNGFDYLRESSQDIYYQGKKVGSRRVDFIVEGKYLVELKAISSLEKLNIIQVKNYTVIYDFPKGLLINFGASKMEYHLIFHPNY